MAVYPELLLSHGGGIMPAAQQTAQDADAVNLFIGVGGTGIDAIRRIKTEVFSRIIPDNMEDVEPQYRHICFLGVDSDEYSIGLRENEHDANCSIKSLSDSEFFSIADPYAAHFSPEILKTREEFSWFRRKDINIAHYNYGAGGIRQVGRFLFVKKSGQFVSRLQGILNEARNGLINPTINVHIFSGLGGGTGSGCFLDICYLVRSISAQIGGANIFGYFFLPDVNLSVIPMSHTEVRANIRRNGYAALQELDYCMQLRNNGGSFVQKYHDWLAVEWNGPPVDMCHLIAASNSSHSIPEYPYEYAMDVTVANIIQFLTCPGLLAERLAQFNSMVWSADGRKRAGMNLSYCSLGAAETYIPMRKFYTYLASELFGKFSCIGGNVPSKTDVETLAISALARDAQSIFDIYNSLWREMRDGFDDSYSAYVDDWKFVRDYGNSQMVTSYTNQTAAKLNIAEKNAKSMTSTGNQRSLIGRVEAQLQNLIRNINYGPMFAYGLISAAKSHNLLNIIDGLIQENTSKWDQESAQTALRRDDYENAKSDFENRKKRSFFDSDVKRFGDYEYYLMLFERHKLSLHCYQKMDEVLRTFRVQLVDVAEAYYKKLARVAENLSYSFRENRDFIESGIRYSVNKGCKTPLLDIADLKNTLDGEIAKINIPGVFSEMMSQLMDHEEEWTAENSAKISRFIAEFFLNVFNSPWIQSMRQLFQYKFGHIPDTILADHIYHDCLSRLTHTAVPLFSMDGAIWHEAQSGMECELAIPNTSAPVRAAATLLHNSNPLWLVMENTTEDRITALSSMVAFPLCAYKGLEECEREYFRSSEIGVHIYEGSIHGMPFSDWRKLPPIIPQSLLYLDRVSEPLKELIALAQELFDKAVSRGVINLDGRIFAPSQNEWETLKRIIEAAENTKEKAAMGSMLKQLESVKNIPMVYTGFSLRNDGSAYSKEIMLRILKDYFIAAPAFQIKVQEILSQISLEESVVTSAINALEKKLCEG